ncbi:MAG: hypothetical protein LBU27_08765 [Candidatus Peribacteria bacterium]|nr:hypothetical protein [Candidatus Peribacteria bacterium]
MTTTTNEPTAPMQSNISIDLKAKNNGTRPYYKPTAPSRTPTPRPATSSPRPTTSVPRPTTSSSRPATSTPRPATALSRPTASTPRPAAPSTSRASSYTRNAGNRSTARITSEIFLKHRAEQATQSIADLKKLIKKDEIPVRVFAL